MAECLIYNGGQAISVDQVGPEQIDGRWNGYVSPGATPDDPRSWGGGFRYEVLRRRLPTRGENYSIGFVEGAGTDNPTTWVDVFPVVIKGERKELVAVGLYPNDTGTEAEMVVPGEHDIPGGWITQGDHGPISHIRVRRHSPSTIWRVDQAAVAD